MAFEQIDPVRIYQIKEQVYPLLPIGNAFNVGNNQTILAGVSGKRIRVMGLHASSASATPGQGFIKSASGGTVFLWNIIAPSNATPGFLLPVIDSGYGETNTGEGLFIDVSGATSYFTIFYLLYTP